MASVIWILSVVLYAEFMCAVSAKKLVFLDCQDENHGVHGKDSLLNCSLNSREKSVRVTSAIWRRPGEKRPLIKFTNANGTVQEDPRFSFKHLQTSGSNINVSFLVRNTVRTDEGKYECVVGTNSGGDKAVVRLSVTATYSKPDMSSVPEKDLQEGMEVTLFCNASGGYPVGKIHWYDQHGTNWTRSAEMTVVEATDKRTNLSSKFTLKASSITPQYWCLVLNNNGVEEGKAEFDLKFQENAPKEVVGDKGSSAIAAVFVIVGSLLCGLLILALLRRRRTQREAGVTRRGSCWRSHGGNGRRGTRAEEHLGGGFPAEAEEYVPSTPGDVAGPRQPSGPGGNPTGGTVEGLSAPIQSSPVHVKTTPVPDQRQGSRTPEDTSSQVASRQAPSPNLDGLNGQGHRQPGAPQGPCLPRNQGLGQLRALQEPCLQQLSDADDIEHFLTTFESSGVSVANNRLGSEISAFVNGQS